MFNIILKSFGITVRKWPIVVYLNEKPTGFWDLVHCDCTTKYYKYKAGLKTLEDYF